ncbi:MAG: Uncharacterized protein FD138_1000 [Planctomycetota bacterium]|nr:MAG: Uncharacterized protein FD138_1000 [Planctomycetota bacterium]
MNLSSISKQLVRDMKASAGKTVVLGVLLLVGLFFWVPPLLKAFSGGATAASTSTPSTTAAAASPTASATAPNSSEPLKKLRDSKTIVKLLHEQSLWQPVSAEEMPQKPFGLNDELLPLPVLIAEDALAEPRPAAVKLAPTPVEKLDGLVLKSTLVGPTRRVAIINSQLYREGQNVLWNDKQLRLESVNRKSVTLTDGSQSWQLTLKDSRGESDE